VGGGTSEVPPYFKEPKRVGLKTHFQGATQRFWIKLHLDDISQILIEYAYLIDFSLSGYLWEKYQIVDQIKNGILIIKENGYDGYGYYYIKY